MNPSPPLSDTLQAKKDRLLTLLAGYGSCAVAYSGGLDSAVLAKAAHLALGERAVAITAHSPSLGAGALEEAQTVAREIGIRHETVETHELSLPDYRKNTSDRCYHCKNAMYARIEQHASALGFAVVVDGVNADDGDDSRPGTRAAVERGIPSPLAEAGLGKSELRALASFWELSIWDKPASPCLSSRIAYGEVITAERLAMVDRVEGFLRRHDFEPVRVRYHRGNIARIEVPLDALPRLIVEEFRPAVVEECLAAGFQYVSVDLEGFRSGSLNTALTAEDRARLA